MSLLLTSFVLDERPVTNHLCCYGRHDDTVDPIRSVGSSEVRLGHWTRIWSGRKRDDAPVIEMKLKKKRLDLKTKKG